MGSYLILGAGKFGRLALSRLAVLDPEARFLVVDRNPESLAGLPPEKGAGLTVRVAEAAAFLQERLANGAPPWDWLIPMTPGHLAFAWLWARVKGSGWRIMAAPDEVGRLTPFSCRGREGELYLSYATELCRDDCPEPEVCPVSGEPRETPLYEVLAALKLKGVEMLVLPSRRLAPGVGGYPPDELLDLARKLAGSASPEVLIATACRCHGVVHGLIRSEEYSGEL